MVTQTPLVLPSFSSVALETGPGADSLAATVSRVGDIIVGPVLISAYDLHHGSLDSTTGGLARPAPLTFIDSGGYENNHYDRQNQKSRFPDRDGGPAAAHPLLTKEQHRSTLERWPTNLPTVVVSFDTYSDGLADQIRAAASLCPGRGVGRLLLLKADDSWALAQAIQRIGEHASAMAGVDAVGLTEKEAGGCLRDRLRTIAALRRELDGNGLEEMPIHVFGGLDPLRAPLYFLAGADIFDGLSWLRYGYEGGHAVYLDALASVRHPDVEIGEAEWMVRRTNYLETTRMQTNMLRFLATSEPDDLHPLGVRLISMINEVSL